MTVRKGALALIAIGAFVTTTAVGIAVHSLNDGCGFTKAPPTALKEQYRILLDANVRNGLGNWNCVPVEELETFEGILDFPMDGPRSFTLLKPGSRQPSGAVIGGRNAESIAMTGWPDLLQMLPKDIQEHHDMSQQGGRYRLKLQGWLVKSGWKPIADRPEVEPFIFVESIQHASIVSTNTP